MIHDIFIIKYLLDNNNNHHVESDWNLSCVLLPFCAILPNKKERSNSYFFILTLLLVQVIVVVGGGVFTRYLRTRRKEF